MKKYNVLDHYEDFVAGPFTEEQADAYCEDHKNEGPFILELADEDEDLDS